MQGARLDDAERRCEVILEVLGYQFPAAHEFWDSNWVIVKLSGTDGTEPWRFTEACMLTWEVQWLAAWMEGLGHGHRTLKPRPGDIWPLHMMPDVPLAEGAGFLEPYIQFAASRLGPEAVDVGVKWGYDPDTQRTVHLHVETQALLTAAQALDSAYRAFPYRPDPDRPARVPRVQAPTGAGLS